MHGESPQFKRCCFCLPLRRGLIGWGYLRMALNVFGIVRFSMILNYLLSINYVITEVEVDCIVAIIIYAIDAVFSVLFIVAGHKKSPKLLRISYIYCIVFLVQGLAVGGFLTYKEISQMYEWEEKNFSRMIDFLTAVGILFTNYFLQVYVILLTRSEEIKLRNQNLEMQFVNNAADAEAHCVVTATDNGHDVADVAIVHTNNGHDTDEHNTETT